MTAEEAEQEEETTVPTDHEDNKNHGETSTNVESNVTVALADAVAPKHDEATTTLPPPPLPAEEEDEEGLAAAGYDVVVCGTGLVHAVLASALSLAGKSVLHCDGSDRYGEGDASLDLKSLAAWATKANRDNNTASTKGDTSSLTVDLAREGSMAGLIVHSCSSLEEKAKNVDDGAPRDDTTQAADAAMKPTDEVAPDLLSTALSLSRQFVLDLTVRGPLLLANHTAVAALVDSNVADYVEFKTVEALRVLLPTMTVPDTTLCSPIAAAPTCSFQSVPCSKGDVFRSKLLTPLEKRKLMKFLQLVLDYGITIHDQHKIPPKQDKVENAAVTSLNERQLKQGRSLSRPQNKTVAASTLQTLQECVEDETLSFRTYLTDTLKLSGRLTDLVVHSLAMLPDDGNVKTGVTALFHHLHSLGRFGTTAFLVPLYGCGELSQAFCRSSAVHGGVYLLRRCPLQIATEIPSDGDDDRPLSVLIERDLDPFDDDDNKVRDKNVRCRHVVVSRASLPSSSGHSNTRIVKRIGVVKMTKSEHDQEERTVLVVPPHTVGNKHAIQGVVVDDSVAVAPQGYAVVYLSSIMEEQDDDVECLDRAMRSWLRDNTGAEEVYHVSYSVRSGNDNDATTPSSFHDHVHVTEAPCLALTVDGAFDEARRLFFNIVGDEAELEFLKLCPALTKIRNEQRNEGFGDVDEDEEKANLESALDMIVDSTTNAATGGETLEKQGISTTTTTESVTLESSDASKDVVETKETNITATMNNASDSNERSKADTKEE